MAFMIAVLLKQKEALRFERIDWNTAKAVAGRLVPMRALEYAQAKAVIIQVAALGSGMATVHRAHVSGTDVSITS